MRAYKILQDPYSHARITVHPDCADTLGLLENNQCRIRFGKQCQDVEVVLDTDLSSSQIGLSERILWEMRLPRMARYMVKREGEEYRFGPFLGILAAATKEGLRLKLESLKSFVHSYDEILGAFIVFSLEGVNVHQSTIEGYVYNPETDGWVEAIYSYPDAVLSIVELSLTKYWSKFIEVMDHFQQVLGNKIFNYPIFNKMEMYKWLIHNESIKQYLPETIYYYSADDIVYMLKKHRKIYVKPITGRLAKGIYVALITRKGIVVKYRNNKTNHSIIIPDFKRLRNFLMRKLTPGEHLIQRGLNLISFNGRIIDFRLMLLKDQSAEWVNLGVISRFGAKQSIVSNITAGGLAGWGEHTIRKVLGISQREASEYIQKMHDLSIMCAKAMEEQGIHGGNFGLDLAIDQYRNLWLIEINNQNPDPYIALSADRSDIFYTARKSNMMYLKRLAGFVE